MMLECKQLLRLKRKLFSLKGRKQSQSVTLPTLVQSFSRDKEVQKQLLSQARSVPKFIEFLEWYLEREFLSNIYTEDSDKRAFCDGKAKQCEKLYNLIKDIENE